MRSRMPPEYAIPDDPDAGKMDAAYLRTCLGIRVPIGETPPPMPLAVRRAHYDMARSLSLLGAMGPAGMDATQLATVVVMAMRDADMEPAKREVDPAPTEGTNVATLEPGQKVVVQWQDKEQPATFIKRGPGGRLLVLVNGIERLLKPDAVRLAAEGEFPDFVLNVNQPAEVA